MRGRFLTIMMLLLSWHLCFAQEGVDTLLVREPHAFVSNHHVEAVGTPLPLKFKKTFSAEIGTGIPPLHAILNSYEIDSELASSGQSIGERINYMVSASFAVRASERAEFLLTATVAWGHCLVVQHEIWGVDPSGQPRYSISDYQEMGRRELGFSFSATASFRYFWDPWSPVRSYSGLSLGFVPDLSPDSDILPGVTPVGIRWQALRHFYIFAENTFSSVATLIYGGLGWSF